MAKLPRVAQKIFAGSAPENQTAVFGTMKTGSAEYTQDIKELMSNPAFLQGWKNAVENSFAPFMEETNGVNKVITQQLAYVLENGIPEWDAETTYYKGSVVKVASDSALKIYHSIVDENTGNEVSNDSFWFLDIDTSQPFQYTTNLSQVIDGSTTKYPSNKAVQDAINAIQLIPVGCLSPFAMDSAPSGWLKCDGSAVSRTTYSKLFSSIGTKYGNGDGSSTFNLPNFINRTFWGGSTSGASLNGTLPNVKGSFESMDTNVFDSRNKFKNLTGAFYGTLVDSTATQSYNNVKKNGTSVVSFEARRSSNKYQDNALVRPESIQTIICIKY